MYISEKDIEFAKTTLSDFVNGGMSSPKTVAAQMSLDHRYLQSEMFKICLEYIKILAMNYQNGRFDGRNEWTCSLANDIVASTPNISDLTEYDWEEYQDRLSSIYYKS